MKNQNTKEASAPQAALNENLVITTIQSDSDSITELLGITTERRDELNEVLKKAWDDNNGISQMMSAISKQVNNPNELAFIMYHFGSVTTRMKQDPAYQLLKMMGQ